LHWQESYKNVTIDFSGRGNIERFLPIMHLDDKIMPYLIDGHNLIPKVSGLSLQEINDEEQLVELLLEFCRRRRKQAEVFFDNSSSGQTRSHNFGLVIVRYVRQGQIADDAIQARLVHLGKNARNWTVVSSDQNVQTSARAARAHYVSSEIFAQQVEQALKGASSDTDKQGDASLTDEEINDWLELFGNDAENGGRA
jgi:predicted RNA-binding protein with PIN domain